MHIQTSNHVICQLQNGFCAAFDSSKHTNQLHYTKQDSLKLTRMNWDMWAINHVCFQTFYFHVRDSIVNI